MQTEKHHPLSGMPFIHTLANWIYGSNGWKKRSWASSINDWQL